MARERDLPIKQQVLRAIHRYNKDRPVLAHVSTGSHVSSHQRREARQAAEEMAMMPYVPPEMIRQYQDYRSVVSKKHRHHEATVTTNKVQTCAYVCFQSPPCVRLTNLHSAYEHSGQTVVWVNCSLDGKHYMYISRYKRQQSRNHDYIRLSRSHAFEMPVRVSSTTGEVTFRRGEKDVFRARASKFRDGWKTARELIKNMEAAPDGQPPGCYVCRSMPEVVCHKSGTPLAKIPHHKSLIQGIRTACITGGMRMRFKKGADNKLRLRPCKVYLVYVISASITCKNHTLTNNPRNEGSHAQHGSHVHHHHHRHRHHHNPHDPYGQYESHEPRRRHRNVPIKRADEAAILCVDRPKSSRRHKRRHAEENTRSESCPNQEVNERVH